ncbi:MAG: MBL fold metallo-hydrolase [Gemmatimonadaceae bacterium]|nr:MBL fold metallo-hydrolase [Gemmatimonadaceae bacterium]
MLEIVSHGDVAQLQMRSWRTRAAGYQVSAYFARGVLIDTGFAGAAPALDGWLRNARRTFLHGSADGLQAAVLTHAHEDHSGNAGLLQERGVPVWIAPVTRQAFAELGAIPWYRRFTWGSPIPLAPDAGRQASGAVELPPGMEVIHAPGHAPDHHVVWDNETGTLFSGDLFLGVRVKVAHHSEAPRALVASLRRLAALDPARMFDAHRGSVPTPAAALRAKADWLEETIAEIERRAAAGESARSIRDSVLGREPAEYYVSFNEYSKLQLVQTILATRVAGGA